MKESADWTKDGGAFCPMPLTYLSQQRWVDFEHVVKKKKGRDPELIKMDNDAKQRVLPSPEIRERLAAMKRTTA